MDTFRSIIIGVITWLICCAIEKSCKHLKANIDNDNNTYDSNLSPKQFRKMYYISLALIVVIFIIAINVTFVPFIKAMVIALMVVSIFFNWCAAENLYEMLEKSRKNSEQDNCNDDN